MQKGAIHKRQAFLMLCFYMIFSLICLTWRVDEHVRAFKAFLYYLISPTNIAAMEALEWTSSLGGRISRIIKLGQENSELRKKLSETLIREAEYFELEEENRRLRELLAFNPRRSFKFIAAHVIGHDPQEWFHVVVIDRGFKHGIEADSPVVALQDGKEVLVGQVGEVFSNNSKVILVTDSIFAISARVPRVGDDGVVEGQNSSYLVLNYLLPDCKVRIGDKVVSAGLGEIFPPGILIGHIKSIEQKARRDFKVAEIVPAVSINKLREVIVLSKTMRENKRIK